MRLTLSRTKVPTQRIESEPAAAPRPTYELVEAEGRLDLHCTVCSRAIACGVRADRVEEDGPFFVEAHAPYCLRVTR